MRMTIVSLKTFPKIDLDVRFFNVSKDWFRHQLGYVSKDCFGRI